ncbi:G-type lectin S-receptor-like serine/threonine-protein kinase B120 [Cocos nucifera]|uniref:Receptor-like serine/threonine-protein kinase n=1 Tax=Cocos nucifera TaxID=13894 RepID=A0A8K0IC44_COCNU|nr:G-type lectin S-receptor-like serine/threonine-protein kinase B120 [Cocos nucifera]
MVSWSELLFCPSRRPSTFPPCLSADDIFGYVTVWPQFNPIMVGKRGFNFCFMLLPLMIESTRATDTLLPTQSLQDGQTLVSATKNFELGFFSPGSSTNRYLGIWYLNLAEGNVIWIANRNSPILDTSGVLTFNEDGDLTILDGRGSASILAPGSKTSSMAATMLDSGNLVLRDINDSSQVLWQSFDYPTDSFLPGMKLGLEGRQNRLLTSWKSADDPAPGDYSMGFDPNGTSQFFIWQKGNVYWTSGLWNGEIFSLSPEMVTASIFNWEFVSNMHERYFTYSLLNDTMIFRYTLDFRGKIQLLTYSGDKRILLWSQPTRQCRVYNLCGAYGVCNENTLPPCRCSKGFEPGSLTDWNEGDTSGGCIRKTRLQCESGGEPDKFWNMPNMRLPTFGRSFQNWGTQECRSACLQNCNCTAYVVSVKCTLWYGNLENLQEFYNASVGSGTLYLRLAASEFASGGNKRQLRVIIIVAVPLGLLCSCTLICFLWFRSRRHREKKSLHEGPLLSLDAEIAIKLGECNEKGSEFSLFHFSHIADATNNFSSENKLGEGGFGPVYKGQLADGQEIAVKRLAAHSGQGLLEFKNEILLILKLQHRNLVRLLGCCIQGEEKILIYEYMPNKSLDFFLFNPARGALLDWFRRYHIVEGIAQGLLYLHEHSRLRVIHRDLKASNVLLDLDMNPKISDFGLARIFGSNETQAITKRVVGTYGYMSPEYAAEGLFSVKSDVFSFGVLLLEIISGKRNTGFHKLGASLNLLGYAWELWEQGNCLELMDPLLSDGCSTSQISRCIHVALMCVQENASDRPTMSDVITMLSTESAAIPDPKQPAFFTMRTTTEADMPSNVHGSCSPNNITITVPDGR